jgi:hypothetical protein
MAEAAIAYAAIELGIGVARPLADERYDLLFDLRPAVIRVQCKWAVRRGATVSVRGYSSRRSAEGFSRRSYVSGEIDAIAAHCAELGRCFFLPIYRFGSRREIQLRLVASANNQSLGVNWADDFDFRRLDWEKIGAIAQLGERRHGMAEVTGSSPVGSISDHSANRSMIER